MPASPNVVLVHGAWADGSGWSTVEVAASHVAMVSQPDAVVELIETAAAAVPATAA
jgi:hypothetical protein